jgi:hypothetical protein
MYNPAQISGILDKADDLVADEIGGLYIPTRLSNSWKLIPTSKLKNEDKKLALRLNCLSNLYYFATVCLGKDRFQRSADPAKNLHLQMCLSVQKDGLKEVIEIPRDHFKSTVYSECFPLWRALPFTDLDAHLISKLGYSDLYIEWMRRAHSQDVRTLIISETIINAVKLGTKLGNHYVNNELFRTLFPEIIPDASCTWTDKSLHQKRTPKGTMHGEGTFDFIGVGAALQSRHYDDIIEDDLVGRAALNSEKVMADTIEYHQLLVGVMDAHHNNGGRDNNEIIVGNRWSYKDLNSHIREEEPYFNFITHSALGGCCALHPYGTPIFPEAFSTDKLYRWKQRLGTYLFSCQFLNSPINPEACTFNVGDIRRYEFVREPGTLIRDSLGREIQKSKVKIRHHVKAGDVLPDVLPRNLKRYMIVDPNHSGNEGRCRHAITVTGVYNGPETAENIGSSRRIYLLDVWAKSSPIDEFIATIFSMAVTWKLDEIWLETIAAQKYLKFHLEYYIHANRGLVPGIADIKIKELKTPKTANAKKMRIDSLAPIFERGEFWANSSGMREFEEELETYGNKKGLVDVLDTLGYGPQVWQFEEESEEDLSRVISARQKRYERLLQETQCLS